MFMDMQINSCHLHLVFNMGNHTNKQFARLAKRIAKFRSIRYERNSISRISYNFMIFLQLSKANFGNTHSV